MGNSAKEQFEDAPETWDVGICETCIEKPKYFCCSLLCGCCFAYSQRKRLLDGDMSRYVCCGGHVCGPCCGQDSCTQSLVDPCPELCLCTEVWCCFWLAISASRIMIQTQYQIANTWLETCLIWLACIASWVICIVQCFIDIPDEVDCIIDMCYCFFSACLQTQQEAEIDVRKGEEM
eukprot:Awhi_evm1s14041